MPSARAIEPLPILVVDDDSALIRTLSDILRMHGYAPATAGTGREGLRLAEWRIPALAVVDLRLPDMDGMELASKLHELSELTEVVVLTGNASVESAVAALRENSVDYLLKPVNVEHLLHVASIATERWQRRHAEIELRMSDERFRRVIESDMLGMTFWNTHGLYDANDAFLKLVGFTRAEFQAGLLKSEALMPPEYIEADLAAAREVAEKGSIAPYEKEFITKSGSRVPVLVGASVLGGDDKSVVAFVLDITERKKAQRAIEIAARQQAVVANFGERALIAESLDALFNEAVALVAGTLDVPVSSVLERRSDGNSLVYRATTGMKYVQVGITQVPVTVDTQAGYTMLFKEPASVGDVIGDGRFTGSFNLRDHGIASGATVLIPGAIQPYGVLEAHDRSRRSFNADDVHFLQAIANVIGAAAERHRTDAAFRQAQRMEAVGRLASGVAHDFNNMLTAITGYGEMVRGELPEGGTMRDDVNEILKAAARAAGLTRQLLAFSRQQVLQPRQVMLNDVVVGIKAMLHRLVGAGVALTTELDPDVGPIKADPGQLEQVILNLCVNARDAMPGGGTLVIETANVDVDEIQRREFGLDKTGSYVMMTVTDSGSGMDAETRTRIFEPFFTTKPQDQGTGLGLATVYGIVKQSGGGIWVYSEIGRGTAFKVFLPRSDTLSDGEPVPRATRAPARGNETVLLAEDEEGIRRIAKRILEAAGYTVLIAGDGNEALKIADTHKGAIDILVTDMVMPGVDGRRLAERLRRERPEMRVLMLSGYSDTTATNQGLVAPESHFLQKPFATESLTRKVREVLDSPRDAHSAE